MARECLWQVATAAVMARECFWPGFFLANADSKPKQSTPRNMFCPKAQPVDFSSRQSEESLWMLRSRSDQGREQGGERACVAGAGRLKYD